MNVESPWTVYRSRFVVRARQLTEPLVFTDILGREQSGQPGDYLEESSSGFRCIRPRAFFESVYVPLNPSSGGSVPARESPQRRTQGVLARQSPAGHGLPMREAPGVWPEPKGVSS